VNRGGQVENPDSVQAITKSYEVEVCFDAYKNFVVSSSFGSIAYKRGVCGKETLPLFSFSDRSAQTPTVYAHRRRSEQNILAEALGGRM
jgi:hypothetical protein